MRLLWRLLQGGIWRNRRTEILGLSAGLAGFLKALGDWAAGDLSFIGLAKAIAQNWPLIAGGFGLAALGDKIARKQPHAPAETVADIAERAIRR